MTDTTWHIPDPQAQPEFYADVPLKRLLAWLIDTVLVIVICLLIVPFTAFTGLLFFPVLMLMVGFAYRVVTLANGSATWGMRLMAIEFRTLSGEKFDLSMAFGHTMIFSIGCAFLPVQLLSVILILTSVRAQGLLAAARPSRGPSSWRPCWPLRPVPPLSSSLPTIVG